MVFPPSRHPGPLLLVKALTGNIFLEEPSLLHSQSLVWVKLALHHVPGEHVILVGPNWMLLSPGLSAGSWKEHEHEAWTSRGNLRTSGNIYKEALL